MGCNARVIEVSSPEEIEQLMSDLGVHPEGVKIMAAKARHTLVYLEDLDVRAANIIKQEMLSRGGEAAVSWRVYSLAKEARSDCVLMGTDRQISEVCQKLGQQPFGLAAVGKEIEEVLQATRSGPGMIRVGDDSLDLSRRTLVMGIVNVTPDSFSDGGRYLKPDKAVEQALRMIEAGADLIDVGGESTRPGAEPVAEEDERARVVPVIEKLAEQASVPISIDTYKASVAEAALEAGAAIVNDVSALRMDEKMAEVVARSGAPVVLMHMKGTPRNMQDKPEYGSVTGEIIGFLRDRMEAAAAAGIERSQMLVDPGIGFGKTVEHNLEILQKLAELKSLGRPIVVGPSRKSFIGAVLGLPVDERLNGTAAAVAVSVMNGASIVRVHDIEEIVQVVKVIDAVLRGPVP